VSLLQQSRKIIAGVLLVLMLVVTTACGSSVSAQKPSNVPVAIGGSQSNYAQLERGNTVAGEDFGKWVTLTAQGLVQDAYVRDNNKLGVVITPQVRPTEVKDLAKSLAQGFHRNFPNQDVSVLVYAPDKKLILTAKYDQQSNQIEYKS
jgi:ABC-type phosphate/phosphonate transport system substrate-binding protein